MTKLIFCQNINPFVIGSAGGVGVIDSTKIYFHIGEPIVSTGNISSTYFTQGFVQPNYDSTSTVLNVLISSSNESCPDAKDGSISLSLFGVQGNPSIIWSHQTQDTNLLTQLSPGIYSFILIDSLNNGSVNTYNNGNLVYINILEENNPCPIDPINSFSPNFDGINESFVINGIENYPINQVKIFNRWGTLIWETKNYSTENSWKGRDQSNSELLSGTYFYIIEIEGLKLFKGWIEILK